MIKKVINKTNNLIAPKCKTLNYIRKYQAENNPHYQDQTPDNYHWLTNKDNPEVIDYLKQENAYTNGVMADTLHLREQLFEEFRSRIQESDTSAPWQQDNYYYYFRTVAGLEYGIFCRKQMTSNVESLEEVLLDENELAKSYKFFSLGDMQISPCHNFLAYTTDTKGNECYSLHVKDLINNTTYDLKISKISAHLDWSADGKSLLYIKLDHIVRPHAIYYFDFADFLATKKKTSHQLFVEPDERFNVSVECTRSKEYLLITVQSKISSEVYYLPASNLSETSQNLIKSLKPREQNVEYFAEHHVNKSKHQNCFYLLQNCKEKPNYELFKVDINSDGEVNSNWQLLISHHADVSLEDFECFQDYGILFTRKNGLNCLNIIKNYDFNNIIEYDVFHELQESIYDLGPHTNLMYDSPTYQFQYESLATPDSTYSINIVTNELRLIKQDYAHDHHPSNYICKRLMVESHDGVMIPVSLIYNKNTYNPNGEHPLLLYGYGSYGISIDPYFSYSRISLLDRGIAFAIAHIRGGGDLGEKWHHQGRLNVKTNTFSDFIKTAEYLIANKYTCAEKLIIHGGSAGGLLIGNVINQRPELFKAAIAEVPFVDCLNTMLDPSLPLTVTEYEEWGNPSADEKVYEYIKSYAPYENIKQQNYPHLLINNHLEDIRVSYWEAAKWAAKLRAHKTNDNILLLKTDMTSGHHGSSGRYQALKETAFNYSFIIKCLQIGK